MEISTNDFKTTMESMRSYYKSMPKTAFPLSTNVLYESSSKTLSNDTQDTIENTTNEFKDSVTEFSNNQQHVLTNTSNDYIKTGNHNNFMEEMNKQRDKSKEESNKRIDLYYDKMIDIGQKYPASQDVILAVVQKVSNFFNGLLNTIANFVVNLVNKIAEWFKETISKIKNFFVNAANSIANFFGPLFGLRELAFQQS